MRRAATGTIALIVVVAALSYAWHRETTAQLRELASAAQTTAPAHGIAVPPPPSLIVLSPPPSPSSASAPSPPPPPPPTPAPSLDQYGWDVAAPYPVAAAMPELTALQALQTSPPLAPSALISVTTAPANGLWTAAECNWTLATLFADYELDRGSAIGYLGSLGLGTSWYYYGESDDWSMAIKDAESECWYDTAVDPSYAEHDIRDFTFAESTHAPRVQQYGPGDTWDVSWADAYLELSRLYQRFDPNHVGCATCL